MSLTPTIAIAGFTGKMARLITASLLRDHPTAKIHGICRSPGKVDVNTKANPNEKVFEASSTDGAALRRSLAGASVWYAVPSRGFLRVKCWLGNCVQYLLLPWRQHPHDRRPENPHRSLHCGGRTTLHCFRLESWLHQASTWRTFCKRSNEACPSLSRGEKLKIKGIHVVNGAFMEVVWAPFLVGSMLQKALSNTLGPVTKSSRWLPWRMLQISQLK